MRLLIFVLFSFYLSGPIIGQEFNRIVKDEKTGKDILFGYCNREGMMVGDFGNYFNYNYKQYKPEKDIIKKIKKKKGYTITIILGSWCHDSKEQVPAFYKILDKTGVEDSQLTAIGLNTEKLAGDIDISEYMIKRVPTFIFYRDGNEIGRIIETPVHALEQDMLMILGD